MQTAPNLVTKFYWEFLLLYYIQIDHWNILCIIVKWWWGSERLTIDLHSIHHTTAASQLTSWAHDEAALFNVLSSINLNISHLKFKRYLNSCQYRHFYCRLSQSTCSILQYLLLSFKFKVIKCMHSICTVDLSLSCIHALCVWP